MTYGELKNRVLELIFSYSVAGSQIPATYNNQADYIAMIPGLVNNGQMDIATSVKRIPAMAILSELESEQVGERILYQLPADCWMPFTGGRRAQRVDRLQLGRREDQCLYGYQHLGTQRRCEDFG